MIFFDNRVDVVVCDGFVGNMVLKTCESLAAGMISMLKQELSRNPKRQLGAYLAQNALRAIKRRMDPEAYGGAPLLGLERHRDESPRLGPRKSHHERHPHHHGNHPEPDQPDHRRRNPARERAAGRG